MKTQLLKALGVILVLIVVAPSLHAADPTADPSPAASAAEGPAWDAGPQAADHDDADASPPAEHRHRHEHRHPEAGDHSVFHLFGDSHLSAGGAGDVVSVFGSSTSEGNANDIVSVFGTTRSTGSVRGDAVAVFGGLFIDGEVQGDAVAVFGNVELGPHAVVDGDLTAVMGRVVRDADAVVRGSEHEVGFDAFGNFEWLHTWLRECLAKGRPLAFAPGLSWAWTLALGALGLYMLLALLLPAGVTRCVQTLERAPGHAALAAFLMVLLTPVLLVILCVTVIGIAAVPFVLMGLMALSLFGKAVILAWLGGRVLGGRLVAPVFAVLVGGLIALALYLVPFLGFLVYKLLGFFGVGAVVYTLILAQRARQEARADRLHETPRPAAAAAAAGASYGSAAAGIAGAAAAGATAFAGASTPAPGETPPGAAVPPSAGVPPAAATPEVVATYPHAGFWVRMVALLIDIVLIGFLLSFGKGFGPWHGEHHLHLLVLATYGAVMWKLRGSTIGGLALDLRVVRLDGRPIEWETAIVRALGCFLSLFVFGLGFIWIAIDSQRQAWHDKIAGTVVVRVPKGTPLP